MRVERTFDAGLVNEIMRHPRVYPHISDDFCPKAEDFDASEAVASHANYFLLVRDEDEAVGVYFLHPHSFVLYEVHTCLLPECWGDPAREAARLAYEWMFEHTPCRKIMTWVPEYNRIARRYALRVGMQEEGFLRNSLQKTTLQGMYLMGMERCQPQSH